MGEIKGRHTGKLLMLFSAFLTATGQLFWEVGFDRVDLSGHRLSLLWTGCHFDDQGVCFGKAVCGLSLMCASYVFG